MPKWEYKVTQAQFMLTPPFDTKKPKNAEALEVAGMRVPLAGPVRATFTDRAIEVDANLEAGERAPALFGDARLALELNYDRQRERLAIDRARVEGPSILATATGWSGHGDGEFAGEWRVRRIQALAADLRGEAGGAWRLRADPERGWVGAVQGQAARLSGEPRFAPDLLGAAPTLDAALALKDGPITVSHARVGGAARSRQGL